VARNGDQALLRLEHEVTTIALVPGALFVAATLAGRIGGTDVSPWISSSIFFGLILGYALLTRAGRRSPVGSYLKGALLLLIFASVISYSLAFDELTGLHLLEFLFVVGLAPRGAADAPLFVIAGIWWISLVICILVAVLARNLVQFLLLRRTSLDDLGG
jgi:hypothetical protein